MKQQTRYTYEYNTEYKYNKEALKGFELLLDKLCSIVTDNEEYVEV